MATSHDPAWLARQKQRIQKRERLDMTMIRQNSDLQSPIDEKHTVSSPKSMRKDSLISSPVSVQEPATPVSISHSSINEDDTVAVQVLIQRNLNEILANEARMRELKDHDARLSSTLDAAMSRVNTINEQLSQWRSMTATWDEFSVPARGFRR